MVNKSIQDLSNYIEKTWINKHTYWEKYTIGLDMEDNLFISWREWLLRCLKLEKFTRKLNNFDKKLNRESMVESNYWKNKLWRGYGDIVFKKNGDINLRLWNPLEPKVNINVRFLFLNYQKNYIYRIW